MKCCDVMDDGDTQRGISNIISNKGKHLKSTLGVRDVSGFQHCRGVCNSNELMTELVTPLYCLAIELFLQQQGGDGYTTCISGTPSG